MMNDAWAVSDDKRTLLSPFGKHISLPKDGICTLRFGTSVIVLLDYMDNADPKTPYNVIAFNDRGEVLWKNKPALLAGSVSPYTTIAKESDEIAILNNWNGFAQYVIALTGEVLRTEITH